MPERRSKEEWLEQIKTRSEELQTAKDRLVLFAGSDPDPRTLLGKVYASMQARAIVSGSLRFQTIRETPLGRELQAGDLYHQPTSGLEQDKAQEVWSAASRELCRRASGNVTVLLKPNASTKSIFFRDELLALLENDQVNSINGIAKEHLRHQPLAATRGLIQERAPMVQFGPDALKERIERQHEETRARRETSRRDQDLDQERSL